MLVNDSLNYGKQIQLWLIVVFRNGSEWWRLRSEFQKGLSAPKHIRQFLSNADAITREFVTQIQPKNIETEDFLPELSRLNLECKIMFLNI